MAQGNMVSSPSTIKAPLKLAVMIKIKRDQSTSSCVLLCSCLASGIQMQSGEILGLTAVRISKLRSFILKYLKSSHL